MKINFYCYFIPYFIGIYYWADGDKYEGEWIEDQKNGKGKLNEY
jgi:hypothetical protein